MQIHELTCGRPLQEASLGGAAGGAWALTKGIGSQMVNQILTKGAGTLAGGPAAPLGGNPADAAGVYTLQQAQPFATQIQKAWTQMVQAHLQNSGATNLAQISSSDNDKLKTQLIEMINKMITANSYSSATYDNLAANVSTENEEAQEAASTTSESIAKTINDIWTATATPTPASNATATAKMFLTLAQSGILPAQHLLKFYPKSGTTQKDATAPTSAPLTPGGQKLAKALKADMASLPAARALAQADPDEAMQQFRELMGLK